MILKMASSPPLKSKKISENWGAHTFKGKNIGAVNDMRKTYIDALKEADKENLKPLLKFVRR